jgi:filamentous hemagglutinin family protein
MTSSSRSPLPTPKILALAVMACFCPVVVLANPQAPQVIAGSAQFSTQASTLTITNTPGTVIDWQRFSIDPGETTRFIQESTRSSVLNRVTTPGDPSRLLGRLESNGRVFLINPAGILVGAGARIDTAGFVASTLDLSNKHFRNGRFNFTETADAGKVENQGQIRTPSGGFVYLVGAEVENGGMIESPAGEVILAAGKTVQLLETSTPGVRVELTADEQQALNVGTILADSGRIGMTAGLVRQSGTLSASSVVNEGGRVFLRATGDTIVDGNSRITATGTTGGSVEVLGTRVAVTGQAEIDASGTQGGGKILVGGDFQGKNPDIPNAQIAFFGPDAQLTANAGERGDGGTVILWADGTTRAYGRIEAKGGATAGNGGFVETSGKGTLVASGVRVDTSAPAGKTGEWLLDPHNVQIVASGPVTGDTFAPNFSPSTNSSILASDIADALANGNVNITTGSGGTPGVGSITVSSGVYWSSASSLTLDAADAVAINAPLYGGGAGTVILKAGTGGVSQDSSGSITAANLAVRSLGSVDLTQASNDIEKLAANVGNGSNLDKSFALKNSASINGGLQIDTVDGITGITVAIGSGNYIAGSSGGVVELTESGSADDLTQAVGATISARALVAKSNNGDVILSENNSTGLIAGAAAGDFSYKSTNAIFLTSIGPTATSQAGINAVSGNVTLESASTITEDTNPSASGAIIKAIDLVLKSNGDVSLKNANEVNSIDASTITGGNFEFRNHAVSLDIDAALSVNAGKKMAIAVTGGQPLSVNANLTAPLGIELFASTVNFTNASISAAGGIVKVFADTIGVTSSTVSGNSGVLLAPLSSTLPIKVSGDCSGALCLDPTGTLSTGVISSTKLQLGLSSGFTNTFGTALPATNSILFESSLDRNTASTSDTLVLMSAGNISASSAGITVDTLAAISASGSVVLNSASNVLGTLAGSAGTNFEIGANSNLTIGTLTAPDGSSYSGITAGTVKLDVDDTNSITGSGVITAPTKLSLFGGSFGTSGQYLQTRTPLLDAIADLDIYISNNTSANSGTLTTNSLDCSSAPCISGVRSMNGSVTISNYGHLITTDTASGSGVSGVMAKGAVTLTANSPLTVGLSGVNSSNGSVTLAANNGGTMTINGNVTASGSINLTAGSIGGSVGAPTGPNVTVNLTGGSSTPTPTPTPTETPTTPPPTSPPPTTAPPEQVIQDEVTILQSQLDSSLTVSSATDDPDGNILTSGTFLDPLSGQQGFTLDDYLFSGTNQTFPNGTVGGEQPGTFGTTQFDSQGNAVSEEQIDGENDDRKLPICPV